MFTPNKRWWPQYLSMVGFVIFTFLNSSMASGRLGPKNSCLFQYEHEYTDDKGKLFVRKSLQYMKNFMLII
jgi:hypothetical protein